MLELLVAALVAGSLGALLFVARAAPDALMLAGASLSLAGLAFGLPASAAYHVRLRRALLSIGPLPRRFWLHPTPHHRLLAGPSRTRVLRAFYVGAAGFLVSLGGAALALVGLLRAG